MMRLISTSLFLIAICYLFEAGRDKGLYLKRTINQGFVCENQTTYQAHKELETPKKRVFLRVDEKHWVDAENLTLSEYMRNQEYRKNQPIDRIEAQIYYYNANFKVDQ